MASGMPRREEDQMTPVSQQRSKIRLATNFLVAGLAGAITVICLSEGTRAILPSLIRESPANTASLAALSQPMPLFGTDQPCSATFENLHAQAGRDFVNTPSGRSIGSLCIKQGDIKVGRDVFHEGDRSTTDQSNSSRPGPALPARPTKK